MKPSREGSAGLRPGAKRQFVTGRAGGRRSALIREGGTETGGCGLRAAAASKLHQPFSVP